MTILGRRNLFTKNEVIEAVTLTSLANTLAQVCPETLDAEHLKSQGYLVAAVTGAMDRFEKKTGLEGVFDDYRVVLNQSKQKIVNKWNELAE